MGFLRYAAVVLSLAALAGCGGSTRAAPHHASAGTSLAAPDSPPVASPRRVPASASAAPGTVPPSWLGKRPLRTDAMGYGIAGDTPTALRGRRWTLPDTVPMLPGRGFSSRITTPAPTSVLGRSTWMRGCPVGPDDLAWVRMTFWGFDGARHTGEMLLNARVAKAVVGVFAKLYAAHFPIERMSIATRAELDATPTGDGNDTGSFVCRPSTGQSSGFSQHAYGLAVDVNTFQNPYVKGTRVVPELARWYLDRSRHAPGMIHPGDVVTRAFAGIGWGWGGSWGSLKDYQHFSANGR